ncbi:MAG: hypothetical protein K6C07_06810 [Bacteroidales bacterium]|nr:hypothetical protein [Bacteroidales bacterium]
MRNDSTQHYFHFCAEMPNFAILSISDEKNFAILSISDEKDFAILSILGEKDFAILSIFDEKDFANPKKWYLCTVEIKNI